MTRQSSRLTEVQVAGAMSQRRSPSSPLSGPGAAFLVHLPEGATVAVPPGFDAQEVMVLLTLVREVLQ